MDLSNAAKDAIRFAECAGTICMLMSTVLRHWSAWLLQGQQRPLAEGDVMQFGASTRTYKLQLGQPAAAAAVVTTASASAAAAGTSNDTAAAAAAAEREAAPPPKKKRARVKFADDAEDDSAAAAGANGAAATEHSSQGTKRNKLEQVSNSWQAVGLQSDVLHAARGRSCNNLHAAN
jgi:hypothetical protein